MRNSVLEGLKFNGDTGEITFQGIRYILIRPDTITSFQQALETKFGEEISELMYKGGSVGGSRSASSYRERFGLNEVGLVEYMVNMGTEIGWGKFELVALDIDQKALIIRVKNSAFARAYGSSDKPVCNFIRGVLATLGTQLWKTECVAIETKCISTGNEYCEFKIKGR